MKCVKSLSGKFFAATIPFSNHSTPQRVVSFSLQFCSLLVSRRNLFWSRQTLVLAMSVSATVSGVIVRK